MLRQYLAHFRIESHSIVTSVSCALLRFSGFHWNLALALPRLQDSLSSDCYVSISSTFRFPSFCLLHQYLIYFKDFLSLDYYVIISCTLTILSYWIVTLVYRALLGLSFLRFLRQLSCIFRIQFHSIFTFVSCAHLRSSFIGKLVRIL